MTEQIHLDRLVGIETKLQSFRHQFTHDLRLLRQRNPVRTNLQFHRIEAGLQNIAGPIITEVKPMTWRDALPTGEKAASILPSRSIGSRTIQGSLG